MLEIKFTGSAEEIMQDMFFLMGGAHPEERYGNMLESAKGLKELKRLEEEEKATQPKNVAKVKPTPAEDKHEEPMEEKSDGDVVISGQALQELRAMVAAYCHTHDDGKDVVRAFLNDHGYSRASQLLVKDLPAFKELLGVQ